MKRREIIKGLSLIPFAGAMTAPLNKIFALPVNENLGNLAVKGPLAPGPQIYQSIGVETFVNCKGTTTIMGGTVSRPEVREAMESAALYNVQMDELAFGVGQRLSEVTGAEWGLISGGAAAGIKLVTIACLTGGDPEKLLRIPDLHGFEKNEVIIPRSSRIVYDHSIRNTGAQIIMVDTIQDLENAISSRTAMIYIQAESVEPLSLASVTKIAKPKNIPIFCDAAAFVLTVPNMHLAAGATVVAYSGGKGLKGPGGAGLLLGNKDLLMTAWQGSAPHNGPGRDNKISREEHIGMLAAVEAYVKTDHKAEMKLWVSWLNNIAKRVSAVEGVNTNVVEPAPTLFHHVTPTLHVSWDPAKLNITGQELIEELGNTAPRVSIAAGKDNTASLTSVSLVGYSMSPGNDKIAGDRLFEVLSRKRPAKAPVQMKTPVADISGRWNATIKFLTSTSEQIFFIDKQEGNWLRGTHKGSFAVREMTGTIDGSEVKLQSIYSAPGDRITSIFYGTVNGDTMTGNIDMGEYITATFTAKKQAYQAVNKPIIVPKGRPQ